MANGSILIVHGGAASCATCGDLLRRAGFPVMEAASVEAALRLMRRATPAALLLRIDADAAALRFCRRVRSHPPLAGLPVLGIIAAGRPRVRLTTAGFSELVREPWSPDQLLAMVARWLPPPAAEGERRRDVGTPVPLASEWRGLH